MLFLTQPAVTKSVQLAEDELGVKLFTRVKGKLVPTEESTFLIPEIERIFGDIVHLQDLALEVRDGHAGRITLATVSNLSAPFVGPAIAQLRERHPKIRFDVEVHSTKLVLERVRIGQVGLGILDLSPRDTTDFDTVTLCDAAIACVMRHNHPLAREKTITPEILASHPIITFPEDTTTHGLVREAFRKQGLSCNVMTTVNHSYLVCSLIDQGNSIGLIDPFHLYTDSFPRLTIRPFKPSIALQPTVVTTAGRNLSLVTREFIGELQLTAKRMLHQGPNV